MRINQPGLNMSDVTIPTESAKNSGLLLDEKEIKNFKFDQLLAICSSKGTNINDSHATFDMLPDVRYTSDILVSETLSPKDLAAPKLSLTFDSEGLKDNLSASDLVSALTKHFSEGGYYDLESKLYKFLEESLVTAGAVPLMVLKKNEIDDFINERRTATSTISTESIKATLSKPANIITSPVVDGSLLDTLDISVTDNHNELKHALIDNFDIEMKLKDLNMENARTNYLSFVDIGRMADSKEGHPLVFKLPVESVIPVHVPGQPDKHVGYYVVCEDGYPISHKKDSGEFEKMSRRIKNILEGTDDAFKKVISVGSSNVNEGNKKITAQDYIDTYTSKVREELKLSLKNGLYRRELEVSSHEDAYQLMFHKSMEKKSIKVIYVPAGIINYIAFDYDSRGIGHSLMEKTKLFSTIRASMLMADIFGSIKSSIPQTNVSVTLDEDDPDPLQTLAIIKDKLLKMTGGSLPIGAVNASDVFESLMRASINMTVEGGSAFPNTRAEVVDGQRQVIKTDQDLREQLKKMHISGLGTSPEKVDRALEGDYAISTATTNFMDARRISLRQKIFQGHISDFIRNYIRLSGPLMTELKKLGNDTEDLLSRIKFTLPSADSNSIQSHLYAYQRASELIDAMVESEINENMLSDTLKGEYNAGALDNIREMAASMFKSRWAREQNIMASILDMSSDDNEYIIDGMKNRAGNIIKLISSVVEHVISEDDKGEQAIKKTVDKINKNKPSEEPAPSSEPGTDEPDIFEQPDSGADEQSPDDEGISEPTDDGSDPLPDETIPEE